MLSWLKNFFKNKYQEHLESFVASKQPKSVAEVEHWIQYYDAHIRKIGIY